MAIEESGSASPYARFARIKLHPRHRHRLEPLMGTEREVFERGVIGDGKEPLRLQWNLAPAESVEPEIHCPGEPSMVNTLEYPDHPWKERSIAYGVEVAIDRLPPEFSGKWLRTVASVTDAWVRSKDFKKTATLWMWGTMSINFANAPGWSEFVVPVGLPKSFLGHLHEGLSTTLKDCVRFSEAVQLVRDDGWAAVCHIQDGVVWVEEDTDIWTPYRKERGA